MHCEQAVEMMSEWLDGRLDATQCEVLESHVATCHRCQKDREALQALDRLFARAPLMSPPADLCRRIMVRLNGKTGVCWAIGGGLALALAAAALGLLFLAPLLANCFGAQHLWPVLSRGGLQTARQILALILALGRTMAVVLRNLAVPLVLLTTYGVVAAVLLNALWLRILRRLDWSVTAD